MRPLLLPLVPLALAGCGHRADPLPPLRRTPPGPTEFRFAQRGAALEVSARAPAASVDGVAYETVEIEFLHVEGEADLLKAGARRGARVPAGQSAVQALPLPSPGTLVRAAARVLVGREAGPRTLTLALVAQPPVEAPRGLAATLGEKGVALSWHGPRPSAVEAPVLDPSARRAPSPGGTSGAAPPAAPTGRSEGTGDGASGTALGGFFVYRRSGTAPYDRPLTEQPLEESRLDDATAPLGTTTCYSVRAVASADPLIESAPSNEACLEVRDVVAPATPVGLVVVPREGGLELLWSPSAEADLAGYRIYRAAPGGDPERVAEIGVAGSSCIDSNVRRGVTYRYTITAFDQSGNESPPARPLEAVLP